MFQGPVILLKNISWPNLSSLVPYLRLACVSIYSNIQIAKGVNIHNNIQKIIFKEILQKISNIFLPYKNSFTAIK